jgi:hypothetical protein
LAICSGFVQRIFDGGRINTRGSTPVGATIEPWLKAELYEMVDPAAG